MVTQPKSKHIPRATIQRLATYVQVLENFARDDVEVISSNPLAEACGVNGSQVRKDLAYFGEFGIRGVGYHVTSLIAAITSALGVDREWRMALIGVGNLGKAIAGHMPFEQLGFSLIGVFDNAKRVIGGKISGNEILDYATVEEFYQEHHPVMAILCVPREYVEGVSDELYSLGIHSFWNFSHYDITMKHPDAIVENVHMNDSLMTLSYKLALAEAGDSGQAAG